MHGSGFVSAYEKGKIKRYLFLAVFLPYLQHGYGI